MRLLRGDFSQESVYGASPLDVAKAWADAGADFIHVVDLDGARGGNDANRAIVREICAAVPVRVEQGGGIRTMADVDAVMEIGVHRAILGTAAVRDPAMVKAAVDKYGDRIAVGIDAKDGFVAIEGWETVSEKTAVAFALEMKALGVKTIIYTDIATDGTLAGPNVAAMAEMVQKTQLQVIASGGVGSMADLEALAKTGVEGAITGKALYTQQIDLAAAVARFRTEG